MPKLPTVSVFPLYQTAPSQDGPTLVQVGTTKLRIQPAGHRISTTDPRWRGGCTVGYRAGATWDIWLIEDEAGTVLGLLFDHDPPEGFARWTIQLRRVSHEVTDLRPAGHGFGREHAFDASASFAPTWTTALAQKLAQLTMIREALTLDARIGITTDGGVTVDGMPLDLHGACRVYATLDVQRHRFVFHGSPTGEHSLDAGRLITSAERLIAHWEGYVDSVIERAVHQRDGQAQATS